MVGVSACWLGKMMSSGLKVGCVRKRNLSLLYSFAAIGERDRRPLGHASSTFFHSDCCAALFEVTKIAKSINIVPTDPRRTSVVSEELTKGSLSTGGEGERLRSL